MQPVHFGARYRIALDAKHLDTLAKKQESGEFKTGQPVLLLDEMMDALGEQTHSQDMFDCNPREAQLRVDMEDIDGLPTLCIETNQNLHSRLWDRTLVTAFLETLDLPKKITEAVHEHFPRDAEQDNVLIHAMFDAPPGLSPEDIADPNRIVSGQTPLMRVIQEKNTLARDFLLKHPQLDINQATSNHQTTALYAAVSMDDLESVNKILAHPDVDPNRGGVLTTPLIDAAFFGRVEILTALLEHPRINLHGTYSGRNAYEWAKISSEVGAATAAHLLKAKGLT